MRATPAFWKLHAAGAILLVGLTGLLLGSCVHEPEGVVYSCDPPAIVETYPKNGGEDFPIDDTIIFVFEHPVDTLSVDTTTVFVIETSSGDTIGGDVFHEPCLTLPKRAIGAAYPVSAAYRSTKLVRLGKSAPLHDSPHPCGTVFFFNPHDSLKPEETYTVIITTDVKDTLGTNLPEINTWTFTTTDTITDPPPGVDVFPEPGGENVPLDVVIEVTFDTLWNPLLFDSNTIVLTLGRDTIPGTLTYEPADTTLIFTPTDSLLPDTTYTVIITVPDGPGGAMGPSDTTYTWTFTTVDTTPAPPLPEPPGVPTTRHGSTSAFSLSHIAEDGGFIRYAWNPLTEAVTYRFQLSTSPFFITTVMDHANIPQNSPLVYQTITPSDVNVGTYYWRVNATNTGGTGAWSPVRTITVTP